MHPSTPQSAAGSPAAGRGEPDPLTRLPTRRQFLDRLGEEIGALESGDGTIAVLLVDIDGFRRVNRDLGHVTGDQLLYSRRPPAPLRRPPRRCRRPRRRRRVRRDEQRAGERPRGRRARGSDHERLRRSLRPRPRGADRDGLGRRRGRRRPLGARRVAGHRRRVGARAGPLRRPPLRGLRRRAARADPLPRRDRPRAGGRPRRRRHRLPLPADRRHRLGPDRLRRGPRPLAPSRARGDLAGALRADRRGDGLRGRPAGAAAQPRRRRLPARSPPPMRAGSCRWRSTSPRASSPPTR